ncbi:MAG TPA: hypothetical protein VNO34_04575 [Actinomycetota bacterium]|nr:hypothetical protein [Actinomycetota bacterium]
MRAQFVRPEEPDRVVGEARWDGAKVEVRAEDEASLAALRRVFRPVPVVVDDPSLRSFGTSGPVVLQPGSLQWFRAAAEVRGRAEGLAARLLPDAPDGMGWDPAGTYRTFWGAVERRERLGARAGGGAPQG